MLHHRTNPKKLTDYFPLLYPVFMLGVFFCIPLGIMVTVSFFKRDQAGFYTTDLTFANYERFISPFFGEILIFTLFLAALTSLICIIIGLPFTYLLTQLRRRIQIFWLVSLLGILSLSEVIIGFAWSTLLSRTAGLSNILFLFGIMENAVAWTPSFGALLTGLVYQTIPFTVLVLYPTVSRLDPTLSEAARTLGSSPFRAFYNVIIPVLKNAILANFVIVFIFALGSYLLPQILGRPQHWTLSVMVSDQAVYQSNMPFAATMAVFLVLTSLGLIFIVSLLGRRGT